MGRVTITDQKYSKEADVINALYYICNLEKCRKHIYGSNNIIGLSPIYNPDSVASQMIAIQNADPREFSRRIYHIGYDLDNALDTVAINVIAAIGLCFQWFYSTYQSLFTVHLNTRNLHLHMIINNVPVDNQYPLLSQWLNKLTLEYIADVVLKRARILTLTYSGNGLNLCSAPELARKAQNTIIEDFKQHRPKQNEK